MRTVVMEEWIHSKTSNISLLTCTRYLATPTANVAVQDVSQPMAD